MLGSGEKIGLEGTIIIFQDDRHFIGDDCQLLVPVEEVGLVEKLDERVILPYLPGEELKVLIEGEDVWVGRRRWGNPTGDGQPEDARRDEDSRSWFGVGIRGPGQLDGFLAK